MRAYPSPPPGPTLTDVIKSVLWPIVIACVADII